MTARIFPAFRRMAVPLASYYVVTLALQVANGAALNGAFVRHALAVLVVPAMLVAAGCALQELVRHCSKHQGDQLDLLGHQQPLVLARKVGDLELAPAKERAESRLSLEG